MVPVGEHAVPVGPLAVRWLAYDLGAPRAGTSGQVRLELENAGSAPWRSRGAAGVQLAHHWLDPQGGVLVWDGPRTPLPRVVQPGETVALETRLVAPRPHGRYRLAFDLVEDPRFWFEEVGSWVLELPVDVQPRIAERRLGVVVHGPDDPRTAAALAAQEEPPVTEAAAAIAHLVPGAAPEPDWSRLLLDAHEEGWAAVGPGVKASGFRERKRFAPWSPDGQRDTRFPQPLLLPSLLAGLEPHAHEGLPAWAGGDGLFEGRAVVRLRRRSGRPSD